MSQAPAKPVEKVHITHEPGVCGGVACIAGTRIRVQDVYAWHELQGKSPDEIASSFPQLSLADVYAALTYFWDHRDEILRQMNEQGELVEKIKPLYPSKLKQRAKPAEKIGPGENADAVSP